MKTKNLTQKLVFSKQTIVNLNSDEMNGAKGRGDHDTGYTCKGSCDSIESCLATECLICASIPATECNDSCEY